MNKSSQLHATFNITSLSAIEAIKVAFAEAEKVKVKVSVAVVDTYLSLIAFSKGDGATPHSVETSRRKANTAASTGKATGWMEKELAKTLPMASGNLLTNIPGGVPLRFDGVLGEGWEFPGEQLSKTMKLLGQH